MSKPVLPNHPPADAAPTGAPATPAGDGTKKEDSIRKIVVHKDPLPLDPTRYGDWVKDGRCIDF